MLTTNDVVDEKVIEACEMGGACSSGLKWLRSSPRSYSELRAYSLDWYKWMASHKNFPATLELLAKDSAVDVRRGIAENASTPVATLELLAKDSAVDVRWGIAENRSEERRVGKECRSRWSPY